jgi:hypothetical protein
MALYKTTAFGPPYKNTLRMQTGVTPIYLFGNLDAHTEPFLFDITHIAGDGTHGTATVVLRSGGGGTDYVTGIAPIPVVGAVMGVRGLTQTGFNTDPAIVTAVTLDAYGAGTISYANTTSLSIAVAHGSLVVWPYEYPDIVTSGAASILVAQTFTPDDSDNSRCLFVEAVWSGTMPSAAVVVLQAANVDQDARYYTLANVQGCLAGAVVAASGSLATIAGSAVTQSGAEYSFIMGKFLRAKVLSMTGGDGTTGLVVTLFA